jgi:hypothetical protein
MVALAAAEMASALVAGEQVTRLTLLHLKVATAVLVLHLHQITAEAEAEVLVL